MCQHNSTTRPSPDDAQTLIKVKRPMKKSKIGRLISCVVAQRFVRLPPPRCTLNKSLCHHHPHHHHHHDHHHRHHRRHHHRRHYHRRRRRRRPHRTPLLPACLGPHATATPPSRVASPSSTRTRLARSTWTRSSTRSSATKARPPRTETLHCSCCWLRAETAKQQRTMTSYLAGSSESKVTTTTTTTTTRYRRHDTGDDDGMDDRQWRQSLCSVRNRAVASHRAVFFWSSIGRRGDGPSSDGGRRGCRPSVGLNVSRRRRRRRPAP
jgi:hypothetical protein